MNVTLLLKVGQIAGALLLAAGVASCSMKSSSFAIWFILGGTLYGGCRMAAWLRKKE